MVGGGGGSSWVAAVILVTERESSLLCPQAQSRSRPPTSHICPKVPPVHQKDFWALGGVKFVCACLCCSEGVELIVSMVLDEVTRGRVVGHTTIYPIQLAPASKTSDCESLQVVILKVNQRLL